MAKDGLLPERFAAVHPRLKTPAFSAILTGVAAAIFAGLFPIEILGELVSIGTLLAFVIVCVGGLVLRYPQPNAPRPVHVPFAPLVAVLGAVGSFAQMLALPPDTWVRLGVWLSIGFAIFFFWSERKGRGRKKK